MNGYLSAAEPGSIIEDTTRLAAAVLAQEEGRLDHAALIFGSTAYRGDLGTLRSRAELVSPLAARRRELDLMSWRVANASKLLLERGARDYGAVLQTAASMLGALAPGDPARPWFELWQCALTTAVDPGYGLDLVDAALPDVHRSARPPCDWTLAQMLGTKATGLALLRRLEDADQVAAEAATWAPPGQESHDQALALRAWLGYLRGVPMGDDLAGDIAGLAHDLGLAELSAAPGALCGGGTAHERAARLVEVARRRPKLDVATPYLLAFAWLALEVGDPERARALVAKAEMYDSSTEVALVHALAAIDDWDDEDWTAGRERMVATYLGAEQEEAAQGGVAALDEEVDRWQRDLVELGDGRP